MNILIDDNKLLCAFIYSAYESGYCGLNLTPQTKKDHMLLYQNYIFNEQYFPKSEIDATQKKMMDEVQNTSIRDYIYRGHQEVISGRIERELDMSIDRAVKDDMIAHSAIMCSPLFYEVISASEKVIVGRNLLSNQEKRLTRLEGLEMPKVGEFVSGHWNYFLEVVSDWPEFKKYQQQSKDYVGRIIQSNHK